MPRRFRVNPPLGRGSRAVGIGLLPGRSSLVLGRLAELGPQRGVELGLGQEHIVAIVGKRGSGKTHTLGVVVEGLVAHGLPGVRSASEPFDHAVLVFDTLNLFQWLSVPLGAARGAAPEQQRSQAAHWGLEPFLPEVAYFHPSGYEPTDTASTSFRLRPRDMEPQDWGRLLGVDVVTEPMGQLLADVHDRVTRSGWTDNGHRNAPNSDYSVDDLINCIRADEGLATDYAPETLRAVRQRLAAYERTDLFSPSGMNLRGMLTPGQVTVLLLARVPEDLRSLVVFLIIRLLLQERAAASELQKGALISGRDAPDDLLPPTWLVIDEAQNVMPSRNATTANDILTRFVREGRNFGLSLALTTQQPLAIDSRVMAQVDTLIAHTLTVRPDINYVLANLKAAEPASIRSGSQSLSLSDALRELDVGQCLVSAVDGERSLFAEIRPRITLHGGFET